MRTQKHVLAECLHMHAHTDQSFRTQTLSLKHIEPAYRSQVAQPSSLSSLVLLYLSTVLLLFQSFSVLSHSQISQTLVHIRIP